MQNEQQYTVKCGQDRVTGMSAGLPGKQSKSPQRATSKNEKPKARALGRAPVF
jgi:hypothetical protein